METDALSQADVLALITELVKEWGSQSNVAARLDITPQYLSDIRLGRREVSEKVARKLGLARTTQFRRVKDVLSHIREV